MSIPDGCAPCWVVVGCTDDGFTRGVVLGCTEDASCKVVLCGAEEAGCPDGCPDGGGCPDGCGIVVGFTDDALPADDALPSGAEDTFCWVVVGLADDALPGGGELAGLLFWMAGRLFRLLIELFTTPGISIGGIFIGFGT
jgi:hypothetical protein